MVDILIVNWQVDASHHRYAKKINIIKDIMLKTVLLITLFRI